MYSIYSDDAVFVFRCALYSADQRIGKFIGIYEGQNEFIIWLAGMGLLLAIPLMMIGVAYIISWIRRGFRE
jgi:hypothetical protein